MRFIVIRLNVPDSEPNAYVVWDTDTDSRVTFFGREMKPVNHDTADFIAAILNERNPS